MSFKLFMALFVICFAAIQADKIPYKDCGSTSDVTVRSLDVKDCSKFPCVFHKGQTYDLHLDFTANSPAQTLENKIYGIIAGVPVPFPIPQTDACKNGLTCPVAAGTANIQALSVPVSNSYPSLSLVVKYTLVDDKSKVWFCGEFPVTLTA